MSFYKNREYLIKNKFFFESEKENLKPADAMIYNDIDAGMFFWRELDSDAYLVLKDEKILYIDNFFKYVRHCEDHGDSSIPEFVQCFDLVEDAISYFFLMN